MDMLTKILGLELAAQKVRVNSVNPGYVITNFAEAANLEFAQTDDYLEGLKNVQPLGGAGTPEDVAKAIRFLASDEASFITGTLLFVDSGRHALIPIGNY